MTETTADVAARAGHLEGQIVGDPRSRGVGRVRLAPYAPIIWTALCAALLLARRPWAFTSPQFFADDVGIYQHAGTLDPYSGYLVIPQRLVAWLASLTPFPELVFSATAFAVAIAVAGLIVVRLEQPLLALAFILAGGSVEVLGYMAEIQWVLGVYLLVVLAAPRKWDAPLLALAGVQGPIALLLWPLFAIRWWRTNRLLLGVLTASVAVQAVVMLTGHRDVSSEHSETLIAIARRGFIVPVFGQWYGQLIPTLAALPIAILVALTAWRLRWWGAALAYVWVVFMVAGTFLTQYDSRTVWAEMPLTERHFYLPVTAVGAVIVLGVIRRQWPAYLLVPFLIVGMVGDFRLN